MPGFRWKIKLLGRKPHRDPDCLRAMACLMRETEAIDRQVISCMQLSAYQETVNLGRES